MKKIGIIGCGWLGKKLASRLSGDYHIYATTSRAETAAELLKLNYTAIDVGFSTEEINIKRSWDVTPSLDAIAILIPLSMKRSSIKELSNKIQNLLLFIGNYDGQLFFSSSTGVYPQDHKLFKEEDLPVADNFIENSIKRRYPQTNILRLGGLMGDDRLLSKYNISNEQEPVNHVHYSDVCSLLIKMIEDQVKNRLYNVVAPFHPSKQDVTVSQKEASISSTEDPVGRVISSEKLINEMSFEFAYPDPSSFHL